MELYFNKCNYNKRFLKSSSATRKIYQMET